MKRLPWLAIALIALVPALACASSRDDYARQWPLVLQDADAGAYRVVLDDAVYRSIHLPSLRDVAVFNGDGQALPAALFGPEQALAQQPRNLELPWFPLPAGKAAQAQDIAVISQIDIDGHVRRVETRVAGAAQAGNAAADSWLIDASTVKEPIIALQLQWPAGNDALDVAYRVEGSDDLRDWRSLQPRAQLLDLVRDGRRLRQARIPLQGQRARYLRLLPLQADTVLLLSGVSAELAPTPLSDWQWLTLQGKQVVEQGRTFYDFSLDGRFPVAQADVATADNDASQWTLQSRDTADEPWQTRAGQWVTYQVGVAGAGQHSPPQALGTTVRDRHWRLSSNAPVNGMPSLCLGYRPEVLVFLAQGKPPYALAAGSGRAQRSDAPLAQLIDSMRAQRGQDWQPARATLGTVQALAGDQALVPAPPERDWKAWLLWALLIVGALVVAGFAVSLLRGGKPA